MQTLRATLEFFSEKELEVLHKILNSKDQTIDAIINAFAKTLQFKVLGASFSKDSYKSILIKIANHNNISIVPSESEVVLEKKIYFALFQKQWALMSEEEQETYRLELEQKGLSKEQVSSITALATLGAAQASGMGVYLLASSTFGAISSLVGVTIPFAFYTTLSSVISVAIGPVGFLVLGYATYKTFKNIKSFDDFLDVTFNSYYQVKKIFTGDFDKATLALNIIASNRIMMEQKLEQGIEEQRQRMTTIERKVGNCIDQKNQNDHELKGINFGIEDRRQSIEELRNKIKVIEQKLQELSYSKNKIDVKNIIIDRQLTELQKEALELTTQENELKNKYTALKQLESN